jgi:hypothetical protein
LGAKGLARDIVHDVLRVKGDLGRFPTRVDYKRHGKFSPTDIIEAFGSWAMMLRASGLGYTRGRRDKQELRQRAHEHLLEEVARKRGLVIPPKISARHLFIPDQHEPYSHPDKNEFLFALDDKYKFDRITIGGDEIDGHAFSFHDHDPDLLSPGHELEAAIKRLEPLYKRWPIVDIVESNHGSLVYRKGKHHGLPRHVLKSYQEILRAPPGWTWHEEMVVQFSNGKKALVHHGISANALLASQKRAMSLIQFHFHTKLSIQYWQNKDDQYFAMQLSCLIDDTSAAYAYNKLHAERPIVAAGAVFDGQPRLFPMPLDSAGRWNRKVP